MALLSIHNLHKQYGNVTAIQSLDFAFFQVQV